MVFIMETFVYNFINLKAIEKNLKITFAQILSRFTEQQIFN